MSKREKIKRLVYKLTHLRLFHRHFYTPYSGQPPDRGANPKPHETFRRASALTQQPPLALSDGNLVAMPEYISLIDSDDDDVEVQVRAHPEPDDCRATLRALFPDMCPVFLEKVAVLNKLDAGTAVDYVLGLPSYDKAPHGSKRKRSPPPAKNPTPPPQDEVARLTAIYDAPGRRQEPKGHVYRTYARKLLSHEFPRARVDDIKSLMSEYGDVLFVTHGALVKIQEDWEAGRLAKMSMKKSLTASCPKYDRQHIQETIAKESDPLKKELLQELHASRVALDAMNAAHESAQQALRMEEKKMSRAREAGNTADCECCCSEYIVDELVSCDAEVAHLFCVDCARTNAEHIVGKTQHELKCMSTDGCSGGFSMTQRRRFLDDKLTAALDRLECEEVLCLAGLENLERCPFCPFAAEYPPITEDKEFRCESDNCGIVSCRLCKEETHLPKTCEEISKEKGMSARRRIEEARSAAMIRKCNKCNTPFIKEQGCNKMACTRSGCGNVQCYVCSKSCAYDHFDDPSRGGKAGNCPLFDDQEVRHETEVAQAEEAARKELVAENPNINEEHLRLSMSEAVAKDDEQRKSKGGRHPPHPRRDHLEIPGHNHPRMDEARQLQAQRRLADLQRRAMALEDEGRAHAQAANAAARLRLQAAQSQARAARQAVEGPLPIFQAMMQRPAQHVPGQQNWDALGAFNNRMQQWAADVYPPNPQMLQRPEAAPAAPGVQYGMNYGMGGGPYIGFAPYMPPHALAGRVPGRLNGAEPRGVYMPGMVPIMNRDLDPARWMMPPGGEGHAGAAGPRNA